MNFPIIYLYMHEKFFDLKDAEGFIRRKKILDILGRVYHVPKHFREGLLKDMERNGMLKKIDRFKYSVLKIK